jgi:hypothetical protein
MKPKKAKKRNKQDATLRNNKARVKEIAALKKRVKKLEMRTKQLPSLIRILRRMNISIYEQGMAIRDAQTKRR